MAEYDLGKAHGEIVIETDERGIRRAEGSMESLDNSARRTAEGFDQAEKSVTEFEKTNRNAIGTTDRSAKAHDNLNKKTRECIKILDERKVAEKELGDLLKQEVRDEEAVEKAINKANRARLEASRVQRERRAMERELQKIVRETNESLGGKGDSTVTKTVKINIDADGARRNLRTLKNEIETTISLGGKTASIGGRIASGGSKAMLGGAAAGGLGLLGGGALGGGVNVIVNLVGAVTELSGLFGALPAMIGSTVAVMGTFNVATAGFAEALKGLGELDFEKGLKDLSQNARDAAWTLNALWPTIKAGRDSIQDNFFKDFSNQILKLSTTVFPPVLAMMQQLASIMNSTIIEVLDRLQSSEGLADLNTILGNIVTGFGRLSDSALPFFDAFMDIMTVSSTFLPQIADRINGVANEFAGWINEMRASGELSEWIQTGIDAFADLATSVFNFSRGFAEIFKIANVSGGGFMSTLKGISEQFLAWTKSTDGNQALTNFFTSLNTALTALAPIVKVVANAFFGQFLPMLMNLGTGMSQNILDFFVNITAALQYMRPTIENLAGPLGTFVKVLGETLAQALMAITPYLPVIATAFADMMTSLGPQLPAIAQQLAEAFMAMVPLVPVILQGLADLAKNVLPLLPGLFNNIISILPACISLFNGIITAVVGIGSAFANGIRWIGDFLGNLDMIISVWPQQAGNALREWFSTTFMGWIGSMGDGISNITNSIGNFVSNFFTQGVEAGKNLITGLVEGIKNFASDAVGAVGNLGRDVIDGFKNILGIESPSKVFKELGDYTMQGFAQGIASGTPMATQAMSGAANSVTSTGKKGVEKFVEDMTQLTSFGSNLLNFAKNIGDIAMNIAKLVTTDIFTGKSTLPSPGWVRTVGDKELRKQQEDKAYEKGLKNTGGVEPGTYGPSSGTKDALDALGLDPNAGNKPPAGNGTNVKPGDKTVPLKQNPDGTWTSTDPAWAALIKRESGGIVDRMQEITDSNGGPGSPNAAQGLFQITPETWRAAGGDKFAPNPAAATAEQQALIAATVFGNNPKLGGDWGAGLAGREDPVALRDGLVAALVKGKDHGLLDNPILNAPIGREVNASEFGGIELKDNVAQTEGDRQRARRGDPQLIDARKLPAGMAPSEGLKPNADLLNRAITSVFGDELKARGLTIGGNRSNDSGSGEHQGGALDIMTDKNGKPTAEGKELGSRINSFIMENAKAFGIQWNIWDQTMHYGDGRPDRKMEDRGSNTENHLDHNHAFTGDPDVSGTGTDGTGIFRMPTGIVPSQILAARNAASVSPNSDHGILGNEDLLNQPVPVSLDENSLDRIGTEYRGANENQITDEQLQAFLGDNPDLQAAIQRGLDVNSSDSDIGNSLNSIQAEIDRQTKLDTPESRYIAGQLGQQQNKIATDRGFTQQQSGLDMASDIAGGSFSLASDIIGAINEGIKSVGAAKDISGTLVRGIENSEDIMKVIDNVQQFINFGAKIATAVSSGLGLASTLVGAGAAGDPSGGASGAAAALGAASSIAGIVSATLQTINAGIDLAQEAYKIVSKYVGKWLSNVVGAGQGGLMGDIKFLLDRNDGTLKAWSEDNPEDKRSLGIPAWMRGNQPDALGSKMRDLNLYVGPGTDPNEAMNTGMWMINTNQGGVFHNEY